MTNKEALHILHTTPFWSVFPQDVKDALSIALVALEEVDNVPKEKTSVKVMIGEKQVYPTKERQTMKYTYKIIFKHDASIQFESDADIEFSLINDTKPSKIIDENKKELWINLDNVLLMEREVKKNDN